MTDRFKAFLLGLFVIAAIGFAAWILLFLRPSVGDNKTTLRVRFSNIERVSVGTRVTFAGKPVGEVVSIREVPDARKLGDVDEEGNIYIYELKLKVDSKVRLFTYDDIIFTTSGLLGERSVALIPRPTPAGMPQARDVTDDILYAESYDKLEQTINQLITVAESFEGTLDKISDFFDDSRQDLSTALASLNKAAQEAYVVLHKAQETDVFAKTATAADKLGSAMEIAEALFREVNDSHLVSNLNGLTQDIRSGQGTLGRLLYDDCLYYQLTGALCEFQTTFRAINRYGLFFQLSKGWQRERNCRICEEN